MTARREIWEVARREFVERWRSRALRISFAIVFVLVVGSSIAATLADSSRPTDDFGLVGREAVTLAPALRAVDRAEDRRVRIHRLRDRAAAERGLRDGDLDVAIVGERILVQESDSITAVTVARRVLALQAGLTRLEAAGLSREQALATLSTPPARVDVLDPGARDRERNEGMLFIGVLLLFGALLVYGQSVASSVAEEKSSRVIELLLTSLAPRRLLAGKVLGVGTLGVLQLAVIAAAAVVSAQIAGGEGLPPGAPETVALVVLWFVLGFAFFSVAYGALGALVSRQEDLEATTAPVNVLLIGAYFAAAAAIEDPNGTWAEIATFVPPLAPMVVPTRVVLGDMGAAGLVATIAIELVATLLLIRVAARTYERSILRIGAPISLRAALFGGAAGSGRGRVSVPKPVLQAGAVAGLLAGVLVGTDTPLGIVLVAAGLVLVVVQRLRDRQAVTHG